MDKKEIARERFHKINFILGDIDCMATKKPDLERSWAVIEKQDLVLHLNVVWHRVRDDLKFIIVYEHN